MTDKQLFNELLDLFKLEIDSWSAKKGELHLLEQYSHLEVFFYDGKKGDRFVHIKDEHDFIRILGQIKMFGSFPKIKENPFFGCKSKEEICIKLDMVLNKEEYEF